MNEFIRKNGYLVQGCYENIYTQKYKKYNGVGRFVSWPLSYEDDPLSKNITQRAEEQWIDNSEISAINNEEFIRKYLKLCEEKSIATRTLLIESMAAEPVLEMDDIELEFLGYDYSQGDCHYSLLIDDVVMARNENIIEFNEIFQKLNDKMIFDNLEDITKYVNIREKLKFEDKYNFEYDYCAQIIRISIVNSKK